MTAHINPSADEMRSWQDSGLCIFCGSKSDSDKCFCRYCDSCSARWIAPILAEYADTDHGPRPRQEGCPDCTVDSQPPLTDFQSTEVRRVHGSLLELKFLVEKALSEMNAMPKDVTINQVADALFYNGLRIVGEAAIFTDLRNYETAFESADKVV